MPSSVPPVHCCWARILKNHSGSNSEALLVSFISELHWWASLESSIGELHWWAPLVSCWSGCGVKHCCWGECEGVTPHKNFDLFLFIDYFIPEILSWLMMTSEVGLVQVCFVGMACFACHDCSWWSVCCCSADDMAWVYWFQWSVRFSIQWNKYTLARSSVDR